MIVEQKMPGFRLSGNMPVIAVIAMMLYFALAEPALAEGSKKSALAAEYSSGAELCMGCHTRLKGKRTAHYDSLARMDSSTGPGIPMTDGNHYCETCHGPAAAHTKRQVAGGRVPPPMDFSHEKPAQEKNTVCLDCHNDQSRSHWMGSLHDIKGTACVDCHAVHAEHDQVLSIETQSDVCYGCHEDKQRAEQADVTLHFIENDQASCSACHDTHADLDAMQCLSCHLQNAETLEQQSSKAQEFHWTTIENNLSCLRCHSGVAHGVPGWVEEIRIRQQQSDD
jgi:predicted CXXCH cytochrome family protein